MSGENLTPITRKEMFLAKAAGMDVETPEPITREEMFLSKIQGGGVGDGGSGSELDALIDGSITEITSNVGTVRSCAFYGNETLKTINLPNTTNIGNYAFRICASLESALIPNVVTIGTGTFYFCAALKSIYCPNTTQIGGDAFYKCSNLSSAYFPVLTTVPSSSLSFCTSLEKIELPMVTKIEGNGLSSCYKLVTIDLPRCSDISSNSFNNGYSLKSLILRLDNKICHLGDINAFARCYHYHGTVDETYNPEGLKDGYIYVPSKVISRYKAATNWSNFATQFRALEDYTVDGTITGELDESKI